MKLLSANLSQKEIINKKTMLPINIMLIFENKCEAEILNFELSAAS